MARVDRLDPPLERATANGLVAARGHSASPAQPQSQPERKVCLARAGHQPAIVPQHRHAERYDMALATFTTAADVC
jgi:hypothetical protein